MEYKSISSDKSTFGFNIINVFKNIIISYVITFILFIIFAFMITYTEIPSKAVSPVIVIITIFSIVLAGFLNGRKASEKGWLTGCVSGFLYMIILYLIGSIVYRNFSVNPNGIAMIICGIFSGIFGGIVGINNKKKYKR